MVPRKRGISEVEADDTHKEVGLLERLRNMWEFACVMQFITIFGDALKIDKEFDINVRRCDLVRLPILFQRKHWRLPFLSLLC